MPTDDGFEAWWDGGKAAHPYVEDNCLEDAFESHTRRTWAAAVAYITRIAGTDYAQLMVKYHEVRDERDRLLADARGAAALRRAFHVAAEEFFAAGEMTPPQRPAWAKFYAAIVDSTAGLATLAEEGLRPGDRTS